MIGRMTLREVREALAAAKAGGGRASAASPTVEELESLARLLEREAEAGAPAEEARREGAAEQGATANGGGGGASRRSAGPRNATRRLRIRNCPRGTTTLSRGGRAERQ